jgi:hypothetical protein
MGRDPKKMTAVLENGLYYVSYTREDDKKQFKYKLKIGGNQAFKDGEKNSQTIQ